MLFLLTQLCSAMASAMTEALRNAQQREYLSFVHLIFSLLMVCSFFFHCKIYYYKYLILCRFTRMEAAIRERAAVEAEMHTKLLIGTVT
jgi:hypothetical protein